VFQKTRHFHLAQRTGAQLTPDTSTKGDPQHGYDPQGGAHSGANSFCFTLTCLDASAKFSLAQLRSGGRRALARAISTVENHSPGWTELLKELFPHTGHALTIGLTGAPGSGKSTLVDKLARIYRKQGRTVGIIAVDPTSPYSGGAILGDRIRMQEQFSDPGIYIRSMATRGFLGGLARATADIALVLDGFGQDVILIETVGVGQDEIDIVRIADITIVILVPGMGDDVQTIKAGIMEIADIFVINKSDHDGAERVEKEIRALQSLALRPDPWTPSIVRTVATSGEGVQQLAEAAFAYEAHLRERELLDRHRVESWELRLLAMLRDSLLEQARATISDGDLRAFAEQIAERKRDPYSVIEEVAKRLRSR
jgi:LAO/AO transport system kinase